MKISFGLASFLISTVALADFSGTWTGHGRLSRNGAHEAFCENLDLEIIQTTNKIEISRFYGKCGFVGFVTQKKDFVIDGSTLLQDGIKVGSINSNNLLVDQDGVNLNLMLAADGSLQVYRGEHEDEDEALLEGSLHRSN